MAECIVLIRKFIKPERVADYEKSVAAQPPVTAEGFLGKTLARLPESSDLPPGLNSFHLAGNACVTYIMVERWASVEAFRAFVPKATTADQDDMEAHPRQRVLLDGVWSYEPFLKL